MANGKIEKNKHYPISEKGTYQFDRALLSGYTTASGNYVDVFFPISIDPAFSMSVAYDIELTNYGVAACFIESESKTTDLSGAVTVLSRNAAGLNLEFAFSSTKSANKIAVLYIPRITITVS